MGLLLITLLLQFIRHGCALVVVADNTTYASIPYMSGPTSFSLYGVLEYYPGSSQVFLACSAYSFPTVPSTSNASILVINSQASACYPEAVATAAAAVGYKAVGFIREDPLIGADTPYIWVTNGAPIPAFE